MKRLSACILLVCATCALADENDARAHLRAGVKLFTEGRFKQAVESFLAAEQADPKNMNARYNALTSMANAGDLGAVENKIAADVESLAPLPLLRGKAAYNAGTAFLDTVRQADKANQLMTKEKELGSAIHWLRQALLDNAADMDAKNNLEIANRLKEKLEQQKQQNQQDNKDQQNQDQNKQDQQKQQQQQKDQQQKEKDKQDQQKQQNQQGKDNKNQPQQDQQNPDEKQQKEKDISQATAKNLLQAAKDAEKRAMKMLREQQNRKNRKRANDGRDW